MKSHYDVIIIGAGPAGLECAKTLGNSKLSVLLIDKKKVHNKVCAGGLTPRSFKFFPEAVANPNFKEVSADCEYFSYSLSLGEYKIGMVERKDFFGYYLRQLKKFNNIDLALGKEITQIFKNRIKLKDGAELSFKFLVGADGSNSIVRKFLNLQSKKSVLAIQYLVKQNLPKLEIIFNHSILPLGMFWIFPHKAYTSVGCGSELGDSRNLKQKLDSWMELRGIKKGKFEAALINCDYRGYQFGNVFLAGDAAGLASLLTGEGISFALISGREIAQKIANPSYSSKRINEILKIKKTHEIIHAKLNSKFYRALLFYLGKILFTIPSFKNKFVDLIFSK